MVRKKARDDRQLRLAVAQPQLGTRPGDQILARYRFLQAADAPVHLETLPENPSVVFAVQPLHFLPPRRHVPARGTYPPDGARSRPPVSQVGTGLARRRGPFGGLLELAAGAAARLEPGSRLRGARWAAAAIRARTSDRKSV